MKNKIAEYEDPLNFEAVTKKELFEALIKIRDEAFSNLNDDWIWIDDSTPLGQFIDSHIQRF